MATGLPLEAEFYLPCALVLAAAAAPSWPLSRRLGRAVLAVAGLTLAGGAVARLAVLLRSLHGQATSSWDAGIQAISGGWLRGQPLYPAVQDGVFYRWVYGPLHHEIVAAAQSVFGIGSPLAGLPMVLAEVAAVAVTWLTARRLGAPSWAGAAAVGVMAVELGVLRLGGVRSDQLLVLLAALALAAAPAAMKDSRAAFWLGLCGGLSMALKFTGFAYVLPALAPVLMQRAPAWKGLLAWTAVGGALGAIAPYLLPGAGIAPAVFTEEIGGYHPSPTAFAHNLMFSLMALAPPLLWAPRQAWPERLRALAPVLVPWAPVFVIACNKAAGPWHMAPFLPALALCLAGSLARSPPAVDLRRLALLGALAAAVVLGARLQLPRLFNSSAWTEQERVRAEIARFLAQHPSDVVAIGSGWSRRRGGVDLGAFQPELPRSGRRLIYMEQSFQYENGPANTDILIDRIFSGCRVRYWLNAPGPPFATPIYSPRVRTAFEQRYRLVGSSRDLAVWICR